MSSVSPGLASAGAALAQDLPQGDPEAGRTCHRLDGYPRIPIAPHIGGEPASYLAEQLKAFRGGRREHEIMSAAAADMTDAEIRPVADWYGAIKLVIHPSE